MIEDFDFNLIGAKLEQAEDIDIKLPPISAYFLVALIQLALRHPSLRAEHRPVYDNGKAIAELLLARLSQIDLEIARSLETGWDESLDMSDQDFQQVRQTGDLPQRNYSQLGEEVQREVFVNCVALTIACDSLAQITNTSREFWVNHLRKQAVPIAEATPIEQVRATLAQLDFVRDFEGYSQP
ncbi:hypothetical protein HJG54_35315 (plasmid) [Leptolyngbya sp. NK1-12]|uniref:Uncharacterized protein n=1 Tax=Leptolyngbya sp. NK1-12 TaxID=2547451 RepID=A0AA97AJU3_9CYAN|nr:hypothetical protein [Leptolyngbya sp. NK1-12]WNZ28185.1 hypothetical protein HJG54_35315 [Leptolyngbya sp. NK1-12]